MSERVFAYYRVSTQDQADKSTEKNQKKSIHEYMKEVGIHIAESFYDPGISGASRERPQFQKMLSRLDEVDGIVVYDPDRLSRDFETGLQLMIELKDKGKLLYVSRTRTAYNFREDQDQLVHVISSWANQQERKKIKARQKLGIQRYIQDNGEWGRKTIHVNWKKFDEYRGYRISHASIARMMGISQATLWRRIKERKE